MELNNPPKDLGQNSLPYDSKLFNNQPAQNNPAKTIVTDHNGIGCEIGQIFAFVSLANLT